MCNRATLWRSLGCDPERGGLVFGRVHLWQDAIDYARGLAVESRNSIVEGEDSQGRVTLRQIFLDRCRGHGVRAGRILTRSDMEAARHDLD